MFCHVPAFCDSLPQYDTCQVFGRKLLRAIFKYVKPQIMDRFHSQRDQVRPEQRVRFDSLLFYVLLSMHMYVQAVVLTNFPPFLNQLDEEIYSSNSPIWDADFKPLLAPHLQILDKSKGRHFNHKIKYVNRLFYQEWQVLPKGSMKKKQQEIKRRQETAKDGNQMTNYSKI